MRTPKIKPKNRWVKTLIIVAVAGVIIFGGATLGVRYVYNQNLKPANSNQRSIAFNIPLGSSLADVASDLNKQGLIKSEWAFKQYVRSEGLATSIKAGTYSLKSSQSTQEIVVAITEGKNLTNLITIIPGKRVDEIRKTLASYGYSERALNVAFNPLSYPNHPALVDLPYGTKTLEGYIYPDSFQKTSDPKDIIRQSLDLMNKQLTPAIRAGIAKQRLTVYEGVTLASIIEQEVSNSQDKYKVAQVFLSRRKNGMTLGSDITAPYGAILVGKAPSIIFESAYNTHNHKGLPPTPISNVSDSSLKAVANPAKTDWLYFVAGDDGKTYFSKTLEDHERLVEKHCQKLCSL